MWPCSPLRRRLSVELLEARAVPSDLCGFEVGFEPPPVEPPEGVFDEPPPLPADPETGPFPPPIELG